LEGIQKAGIRIHLGSLVVAYDYVDIRLSVKPFLAPDSERGWVEADVILASDRLTSNTRSDMLKGLAMWITVGSSCKDILPSSQSIKLDVDTGQAAYRILLQRDVTKKDPELLKGGWGIDNIYNAMTGRADFPALYSHGLILVRQRSVQCQDFARTVESGTFAIEKYK